MSYWLYAASALLISVAIAHSYLGERYILRRLFRRTEIPKLFGGTEFTVRTLRFAWHITSIAWFGFAALFILLAMSPEPSRAMSGVLAGTLIATCLAIFVGSRGKHLAWIVFLVTGGIAFYAAVG